MARASYRYKETDRRAEPQNDFLRWQDLMRQLQADIGQNFLAAVRAAIVSSAEIAAMAFTAWHLANLPTCSTLVDQEMRGAYNNRREMNPRRFVHFLFWRLNPGEKRSSNHLRNQIIATIERLDNLVVTKQWKIFSTTPLQEIIDKIKDLGGITQIYDGWRLREKAARLSSLHRRYESVAKKMGDAVENVIERERAHNAIHQDRRDAKKDEKFINILPEITEKMSWSSNECLMLVVAIREENGDMSLLMLKKPYRRRMINAVVNPVTPIE